MGDESLMVLNLDVHAERVKLMQHVGTLRGLCEVRIKRRKRLRSLDANAYYFAAICTPFMHWLREQEGDPTIDKDYAHELLKGAVLGTKTISLPDGGFMEVTPRTRGMKSDEFAQFIEAAGKWVAEFCEIAVIPSELFYETKGK